MKMFALFLLVIILQSAFAQKPQPTRAKHYLSLRGAFASPLGIFDDNYYGGFSVNGIIHFKWLKRGAEVQLIAGYEQFPPKEGNIFGSISTIPLKVGLQQMVSKKLYLYGRMGGLIIKDQRTTYAVRFSTDVGLGYTLGKFAIDIGFHGWSRKNSGGFASYFSAGVVFPFKKSG